jgi:hypothetical protein
MLQDILEKAGNTPPDESIVKSNHDQVMQTLFRAFATEMLLDMALSLMI